MRFNKYGRTYQLNITDAQGVRDVLDLDECLWVASSAPVTSFRTDMRLLKYIDFDANGRINTREVKDAILWTESAFGSLDALKWGADSVALNSFPETSDIGRQIRNSGRYIIRTLKSGDDSNITLGLVRRFLSDIRQQALNGDGTVILEATTQTQTREFITDVITHTESTEDASGKPGVTRAALKDFMDAVHAFLNWRDRETHLSGDACDVMLPLGEQTANAFALYAKLKAPIDHYFSIVNAVHFRPELRASLDEKTQITEGAEYAQSDSLTNWLAQFPIAAPRENGLLPLDADAVNPIHADDLQIFRETVLVPILDENPSTLSPEAWHKVSAALQPFTEYMAQKKGAQVESLPIEKLRRYAEGQDAATVEELIKADQKVSEVVDGAQTLEKAILYQKFLLRLLNNFVSFSELYTPDQNALFETGSLLIDGRWFNLALCVEDIDAHSAISKSSNIFTIYLEITRQPGEREYIVAVPATSGTKGNLVVGKRGVFFDQTGREHEAKVLKIIENPISLTEALCLPFSRLWAFILGKIEAISTSSEQELQKATDAMMKEQTTATAPTKAAAPTNTTLLMGLSVSVAALGSAFAFISQTLSSMSEAQIFASFLGAAAVVIVPVSLVATLKLRRQDMSSLLEGSGWGVNARMRFTFALRRQFTRRAPYPTDAEGAPRSRLLVYILTALIIIVGIQSCSHHFRSTKPPLDTSAIEETSPKKGDS